MNYVIIDKLVVIQFPNLMEILLFMKCHLLRICTVIRIRATRFPHFIFG